MIILPNQAVHTIMLTVLGIIQNVPYWVGIIKGIEEFCLPLRKRGRSGMTQMSFQVG
jgi:hypothetical protein